MSKMLRFCKRCHDNHEELLGGYCTWQPEHDYTCPIKACRGPVVDTIMTAEEYDIIWHISSEINFIDSMLELKEKNIIEFESKMAQFRIQVNQMKTQKQQKESAVRCPHCGSTEVELSSRGFSLFWGFIGSASPRNVCKKCGWKWKPGKS